MGSQGERVKKIRQALNLSQTEFGNILGIGKQFISKIENNTSLLNNDKLVTLLVNYNTNINYILGGVGDMFIKAQQPAQDDDELAKKIKKVMLDTVLEYGGEDMVKKIFKNI